MGQKIVRVWVNEDSCLSHWACKVASSVFIDTGKHHPVVAEDASHRFETEKTRIIEAVMSCPTASLFLEFEDGRVVSSREYQRSKGVQEWVDD